MKKFENQMKYVVKSLVLTLLMFAPVLGFYAMTKEIINQETWSQTGWVMDLIRKVFAAGMITSFGSSILGMILGDWLCKHDYDIVEEIEEEAN